MTEDWFTDTSPSIDMAPFEDAMRELVMEHPAGLPRLRRRGRTHWAAAVRLMVVFFTLGFAAASLAWWLL